MLIVLAISVLAFLGAWLWVLERAESQAAERVAMEQALAEKALREQELAAEAKALEKAKREFEASLRPLYAGACHVTGLPHRTRLDLEGGYAECEDCRHLFSRG